MANLEKASPGVEVELAGKRVQLIFNMRAFMLLEKHTGKNVLNGELFGNPSLTDLITLTWAALQHGDPKARPTIEQVADMLSFADFPRLTTAIQTAFEQATPSPEKNEMTAGQESVAETVAPASIG